MYENMKENIKDIKEPMSEPSALAHSSLESTEL